MELALIVIKVILLIGTATAQEMVRCSTSITCSVSLGMESIGACCSHGVAFAHLNSSECVPCPKFGFSLTNFSGYERSEPYSVQVGLLQGNLEEKVTFRVILQTAMSDTFDVLFENSSVFSIDSENPTALLYFVLNPDGIAQEFNETFSLKVVNISAPLPEGTELIGEMNGTILDHDEVSFQFRSVEYVAYEGEDEAVRVQLSKTPGIRLANPVTFNVSLVSPVDNGTLLITGFGIDESVAISTQADSNDFVSWNSTQIFEPDEGSVYKSSIKIVIMIKDDFVDEPEEEYFAIRFEVVDAVNPDLISIGENICIINIIDNDECDIGFNAREYQFNEPRVGTWINNSIYLVKRSNCLTDQTLYVGVATVLSLTKRYPDATLDTSTTRNDYNLGSAGLGFKELVFPPDKQNISFNFFLNEDYYYEGNEEFHIVLFPIRLINFKANESRATVVIKDNEKVVVGFEKMEYSVKELSSSLEVCVNMTAPSIEGHLFFNIYLVITLVYGSADEGDVQDAIIPVLFPSDKFNLKLRRICKNISIINDQLPENAEYFELNLLYNEYSSNSGLIITPRNATVIIDDDDVRCQDSMINCYSHKNCSSGKPVETKNEIECCNNWNFHASHGVSFKCGDEDVCYDCPIVFGFDKKRVNLPEWYEQYHLEVAFYWGFIDHLELQVELTQPESGSDVMLLTDRLIFKPLIISQSVTLNVRNNLVSQEYDKKLLLRLNPTVRGILDSAITILETEITVQDTDNVYFEYSDTAHYQQCISDENQPLQLEILKLPGVSLANNITFEVDAVFLQNEMDLDPFYAYADSSDLIFSGLEAYIYPGDPTKYNLTSKHFNISIADDNTNEALYEVFVVIVEVVNAVNPFFINLFPFVGLFCIIVDDDPIYIGFEKTEYTLKEVSLDRLDSFPVFITIIKEDNRSTEQSLIVHIDVLVDGKIIKDKNSFIVTHVHYPTNVFFPPEKSAVDFDVSFFSDNVFNGVKIFNFCLRPASDSPKFNVSSQSNCTTLKVLDEYSTKMGFSRRKYYTNESSQGVEVMVELIQPNRSQILNFTINFHVQIVAGTADSGDFDSEFKKGKFPRDEGSHHQRNVTIFIPILDDNLLEQTESFMLHLEYDPDSQNKDSSDIVIEVNPNTTEVCILDDDGPVIGFKRYPHTFDEGSDMFNVTVGLKYGVLVTNVSVNISAFLEDGSGFCGLSYEIFEISPQYPSFNYTLCFDDDNEFESTRQLKLTLVILKSPNNLISIDEQIVYILIHNEDKIVFMFNLEENSVYRDEDSVSFMVSVRPKNSIQKDYTIILQAATQSNGTLAGIHQTSILLEFNSSTTELPLVIPIRSISSTGIHSFQVKLSLMAVRYKNEIVNLTDNDHNNIILPPPANVTILDHPTTYIPSVAFGPVEIIGASLLALAIVVVIFIVILFCLIYVRVIKKKLVKARLENRGGRRKSWELNRVSSSYELKLPRSMTINSCNLEIKESVGYGQYGIVYRGYLSRSYSTGCSEVVAVKTLRGFLNDSSVKSLLEECSKMAEFDHPNVLTLTGVCLDGGPVPYIVMPFMFNGSLWSYLIKKKEDLCIPCVVEEEEKIVQASLRLSDMCLQIAKGMEYLASKRVVHRDLATRNCMVDMNSLVKVCDFGLSQSMNPSKDYYREEDKSLKLPFKWMAPESLDEWVFSTKSDVWSYGVTCWEVFSCGKAPHPGVNAADLSDMLQSGYRMKKPLNAACSDVMYDEVLRKCWELKPDDRPSFTDLVALISSILESNAGYFSFIDDHHKI